MELVSGKKENDASNNTQTSSDEDRERLILDLKAGLHPLRVRFLPFFSDSVEFDFLLLQFSCFSCAIRAFGHISCFKSSQFENHDIGSEPVISILVMSHFI